MTRGGEGVAAAGEGEPHTVMVYRSIRQRILENEYPPGAHISIKELATDFGVSRTPIRDALIRLEKEGLTKLAPHRGVYILPMSADDMREIYQILAGLEMTAIEAVCERGLTAEDFAPLERAVGDMEDAVAQEDLTRWAEADERFHAALVELSGNQRLVELVHSFNTQTHRARLLTLKLRAKPDRSTHNHREVLECIRAGDRGRARDIHAGQRFKSAQELLDILASLNMRYL